MQFIAFDLGNVLIDVDLQPFWSAVDDIQCVREDVEDLLRLYERPEFCGDVDMLDVFRDALNNTEEAQYLTDSWCKGLKPDEQMFNFISSLKSEGVKIAYLSNIGSRHLSFMRNRYPEFMKCASVEHMSCEVGAAKPSLIYYQSFLLQHDDFKGCTYLDDRMENVLMGSKCKFNSVHFDLEALKKEKPSVLKNEINKIKERMLRGC